MSGDWYMDGYIACSMCSRQELELLSWCKHNDEHSVCLIRKGQELELNREQWYDDGYIVCSICRSWSCSGGAGIMMAMVSV